MGGMIEDSVQGAWDKVQKMLALVIFNITFLMQEIWRLFKPLLTPFITIYNTIDLANLDVLYVIQCFAKCYLMVVLYCWRLWMWGVKSVVHYLPYGRRLQDQLCMVMYHMDMKHRYLLRPINQES